MAETLSTKPIIKNSFNTNLHQCGTYFLCMPRRKHNFITPNFCPRVIDTQIPNISYPFPCPEDIIQYIARLQFCVLLLLLSCAYTGLS